MREFYVRSQWHDSCCVLLTENNVTTTPCKHTISPLCRRNKRFSQFPSLSSSLPLFLSLFLLLFYSLTLSDSLLLSFFISFSLTLSCSLLLSLTLSCSLLLSLLLSFFWTRNGESRTWTRQHSTACHGKKNNSLYHDWAIKTNDSLLSVKIPICVLIQLQLIFSVQCHIWVSI